MQQKGVKKLRGDGEKWHVLADKVGAHVYRLHKVGKAGRGRLQGLKVGGSGHGEQGRVLRDQIEDRHEHEVFALEEIEELVRGDGHGHHYLIFVGEYERQLTAGERGQTGDHFLGQEERIGDHDRGGGWRSGCSGRCVQGLGKENELVDQVMAKTGREQQGRAHKSGSGHIGQTVQREHDPVQASIGED